jgi:hypothetical protein
MVVNDFDIGRSSFLPNKANSPLIIDTDRMLACPITPQRLEPVSWRYAKILQDTRIIEDPQFS